MQKTAKYDMFRGERVLRKFDTVQIDRVATLKAAFEVVDSSEVIEAGKRVQFILDNYEGNRAEYRQALKRFDEAKVKYQVQCMRHANKNPIHFEPRANEILL